MKKSSKLANIVLLVLMIISALFCVIIVATIQSETDPGAVAEKWIGLSLNWSIILTVIAGLLAVGFAVVQILGDKKSALNSLLYLALFAVVLIVSYVTSSSAIPQFYGVDKFIADGTLTPFTSKLIGAGLISTYILAAIATLAVLAFGAATTFRRSDK